MHTLLMILIPYALIGIAAGTAMYGYVMGTFSSSNINLYNNIGQFKELRRFAFVMTIYTVIVPFVYVLIRLLDDSNVRHTKFIFTHKQLLDSRKQ